jgi:glyoxylase-like metal-dependent hydrolase (beta-lactamase superfamily II)
MRHPSFAAAWFLAVVTSLHAQGKSPTLDRVAEAMGGRANVLAVRSLVLEGTGGMLNFGQNHTPAAETKWAVTRWRRTFDFANQRWFTDLTRVPRFPSANPTPQRQRVGLDGAPGGGAFNVTGAGAIVRLGGRTAVDRVDEFVFHPVAFIQVANTPGAQLSEEAGARGMRRVRLTLAGRSYAMDVSPATNLPVRIERVVYHPMLGDVPLHTTFDAWSPVGTLRLPMRISQGYENLYVLWDIALTSVRLNEDVSDIALPDTLRRVAQSGELAPAPAPTITIDTLAPGVWLVAGQSHHTVVVEHADQLVLIEAPQNERRTLAAIEAARALRPGKQPAIVVNTHHHFDHAGGIRAAAAEGLTILTHEENRAFYEAVVMPRRHFIEQDALARSGRGARVRGVRDREVLRDRERAIELYHVPNDHSGSMLVAYLPSQKLLVQADLYNPPAGNTTTTPAFPFVHSLVELVGRRGLQVERVVGIHGRPVPFSELQAAAQRAP